ncbi:hypothetical protein LJC58_09550 [Lachnospiraceae bacterium OttesenSCG-928-D06]|nr:hypothetical protein [Lachnospiraceae bacterium OttesenSCG-928-D06]
MTEQESIMILFSGSFLIVWTTFKWKVPNVIWDNKWYRLYARMLGSYTIIIAVLFKFLKVELPMAFYMVNLILFLLLTIGFMMTKIKKARKGIIRNLQLGFCLVLTLFAVSFVCFDVNEVASSIMGLSGVMICLTPPFEELSFVGGKRNGSKQNLGNH